MCELHFSSKKKKTFPLTGTNRALFLLENWSKIYVLTSRDDLHMDKNDFSVNLVVTKHKFFNNLEIIKYLCKKLLY